MFSSNYHKALMVASLVHKGQMRTKTNIPYITHPVAVAELVARHGGTESQQLAALLHDVLEDGGQKYVEIIRSSFGGEVLALVQALSDSIKQADAPRPPWKERKEKYLQKLNSTPKSALLVALCDKYHNACAIRTDLIEEGAAVFSRFAGKDQGTLWYYAQLSDLFAEKYPGNLANKFSEVVAEIQSLHKKYSE